MFTKKVIVLIIFIAFSNVLLAQASKKDTLKPRSQKATNTIALCYGYKMLDQNFYSNFNTLPNFSFGKPLQTIGVSMTEWWSVGARGARNNYLYYNQFIPQTIVVNNNTCKITGFVFGFSMGADLLRKSKHFDLLLNGGFNTGRLRLYNNNLVKEKNPFFAPKISLQPRVCLNKLVISLTMEYDYDISKARWLFTGGTANLNSLKQSGFTTFINIGYAL